jgi:hypothetical protein
MKHKSHKDLNQLAKSILEQVIGESPKEEPPKKKNSATVELGGWVG